MKMRHSKKRAGYALVIVMFFSGLGLMALTSALKWTSTNVQVTQRNNEYFNTVYAAEAASEKVLAKLGRDYLASGEGTVYSSLSTYQGMYPTSSENSYWNGFEFNDASGHANKTYISRVAASTYTNLTSQYAGLNGL